MINQFRTLLLNLTDIGDNDEHITPGYSSKILTPILQSVYDIIFPKGYNRDYALYIAHSLLQLINAAGLDKAVVALDKRITYPNNDDYFKINRRSNPIVSDQNFPLFVYGNYNVIKGKNTDKILIQQNVDTPTQVSVFSYSHGKYIVGSQFFSDRQFITINYTVPTLSDLVTLDIIGLRFNIGKVSGSFTDTTSKVWQFLIDTPQQLDLPELFNSLNTTQLTNKLFNIPCKQDVSTFDNIWRNHPNWVYRLAALIISYVYRVNDL